MRIFTIVLSSILGGTLQAQAQNGNFSRITVRDSIWLNGKWIRAIAGNVTPADPATNVIPSQQATKIYIDSRTPLIIDSVLTARKGKPSGIAPLDITEKIPREFLPEELDPIFAGSIAATISGADTTRWNHRTEYTVKDTAVVQIPPKHVNISTTISAQEVVIIFDVGNIHASLPDPATCNGHIFLLKNMSPADPVTFNYPIKIFAADTVSSMAGGNRMCIVSDGINWYSIL